MLTISAIVGTPRPSSPTSQPTAPSYSISDEALDRLPSLSLSRISRIGFKAPPGKAKHAKLEWKSFSDESQAALLTDAAIAKINKERRDECKGVSMGDVSKKCVTAVDKLSESIAAFVKGGGEVPVPKALK